MTEKSVFREAWSPKMTSQSFPSPVFGLAVCTPPEVKFDALGTSKHGEGKSLSKKIFLLYLSVHRGDLIEQVKKSVIYPVRNLAS